MGELQHTLSGLMTGMLLLTFIGICFWSWSGKRKEAFEEMANLPLDNTATNTCNNKEKSEA
ncbi:MULTISPECIES: CcoQ/FixQ family Cbb3-type cytochrome c oxidase assembly chaperone [unclassified Oleiphilus]|jgi:cytochrome c oxidase cbb3-type subunit 4|uniref:CcoQ/FixQ family Cbb3-type cytochrome c oxidase assembly chaperone n=1 Tax=unclassified Oleiphilus TaxID=2631174 RepID=UPI0007C3F32F|nr:MULTISPECIES: CcoQ/FixQ family Cbb3-type cytochrome c oxidase assembly chaperone [unclassified Oleiphilus]KZY43762.1 hypothetical protein A3732_13675 [Oleiphilus sp. HI0050]KZY80455.1 hypothetical protein A3740_26100 [Oleiphilus sp. HI0068]KZY88459.1 hypothetical protein A3741_00250 [Oleiphilus sp. HI0069]KZY91451.1 hypothetical protein A3743_00660 [Oleiphilus sp. HI0072]KZZ19276.1 hypothetical protein A3749_03655 [Oleiphilus sp. HI0078]KZZ21135.1 hypothetical protein A3752_09780 [Oleiphil